MTLTIGRFEIRSDSDDLTVAEWARMMRPTIARYVKRPHAEIVAPRLRVSDGRNPRCTVRDAAGTDVTNAYTCECGDRFTVRASGGRTNARALVTMCRETHPAAIAA